MKAHTLPTAAEANHPHEDQPLSLRLVLLRTRCDPSPGTKVLLALLALVAGAVVLLLPVVLWCGAKGIYP